MTQLYTSTVGWRLTTPAFLRVRVESYYGGGGSDIDDDDD